MKEAMRAFREYMQGRKPSRPSVAMVAGMDPSNVEQVKRGMELKPCEHDPMYPHRGPELSEVDGVATYVYTANCRRCGKRVYADAVAVENSDIIKAEWRHDR